MCRTMAILSMFALACFANSAAAALRVPQVVVNGGGLQGFFNGMGESIHVDTDQEDMQHFQSPSAFNNTFTFQIELSGNAAGHTIGIYNAGSGTPPLYPLFPAAATPGWFAVA